MRRSSSRNWDSTKIQNNVRFETQIRERDDVDVMVDFLALVLLFVSFASEEEEEEEDIVYLLYIIYGKV